MLSVIEPKYGKPTFKKTIIMSGKNKKQFGVWIDSQQATIAGRENIDSGSFVILTHIKSDRAKNHSSEKTTNNAERMITQQFFKEIASHMQNVEEILVTGTGDSQEQFIHFLSETAQFKNAAATESTSNKMGDQEFIALISAHFN